MGVIATVDIIVPNILEHNEYEIVFIERGKDPFKGKYALPGGHVDDKESVENAAMREAKEETSLKVRLGEILGVYSAFGRDPRGHTIGTVFIAESFEGRLKAKTDAAEAKWMNVNQLKRDDLAFDHYKIVRDYQRWLSQKGTYWSTK